MIGDAAKAEALCKHLGATFEGNFEGKPAVNVLTRATPTTPELAAGRLQLFEARGSRVPPGRDDKILAGWNGLAISAFARGAAILGEPSLGKRARAAANFVAKELIDSEGHLLRSWLERPGRVLAFGEDYAFLTIAHLDLYDLELQPADLDQARTFADALLDRFFSEADASVAIAARDAERLVHQPLGVYDNAIPGATSAALEALQRLAWLTGHERYRQAAAAIVRRHTGSMVNNPFGFGNMLCGLDRELRGPIEVVVIGALDDSRTRAMLAAVHQVYLPNRTLAHAPLGAKPNHLAPALWQDRAPAEPTVYVCLHGTCLAPITEAAKLPSLLREARAHTAAL